MIECNLVPSCLSKECTVGLFLLLLHMYLEVAKMFLRISWRYCGNLQKSLLVFRSKAPLTVIKAVDYLKIKLNQRIQLA